MLAAHLLFCSVIDLNRSGDLWGATLSQRQNRSRHVLVERKALARVGVGRVDAGEVGSMSQHSEAASAQVHSVAERHHENEAGARCWVKVNIDLVTVCWQIANGGRSCRQIA